MDGNKRMGRRRFLERSAAAALGGAIGTAAARRAASAPQREAAGKEGRRLIWANLLHLSYNMWEDWIAPGREVRSYRPFLRFDESLWRELLERMSKAGLNMVVIDLGDGVRYRSHPEIAVKNAWSVEKLKDELKRVRDLGLEPIPKMNFAATHDTWLGEYARAVSTPRYYQVCRDLIAEVVELFDGPRFFHLGMDEETCEHQRSYRYVVVRQFDLWWDDLAFYCDQVRKGGARPWIWSDVIWRHPKEFEKRMAKDVVQSNWYYSTHFDEPNHPDRKRVDAYLALDRLGYDQIPTGSNHSTPKNFGMTVEFCTKRISRRHLLGFLQTPWRPTLAEYRDRHLAAIAQVDAAIAKLKG